MQSLMHPEPIGSAASRPGKLVRSSHSDYGAYFKQTYAGSFADSGFFQLQSVDEKNF
jgi:hypothetical protein